jgi:hypothetical protein
MTKPKTLFFPIKISGYIFHEIPQRRFSPEGTCTVCRYNISIEFHKVNLDITCFLKFFNEGFAHLQLCNPAPIMRMESPLYTIFFCYNSIGFGKFED